MDWEPEAERALEQLCGMVPDTYRELARASARGEAEVAAGEREAALVGPEDVVVGWIRLAPPDQRDGLVPIIESLGHDPMEYADELQAEGGTEEPDDPTR
jgi:hypothetical protein